VEGELASSAFIGVAIIAVVVLVVPRFLGGTMITCTRCNGTGQIDEKWPDPSKPTGFHIATGTCPKCKGKGRVKP
jgi:hypothetical protein